MLGPLLFLISINDIPGDLASLPLIYADDTTLIEIVDDPAVSAGRLNPDLNKIALWADKWLVTMNPVKTRNVFSLKRNKQNQFDSKAGTTARAIETLMGQYFD